MKILITDPDWNLQRQAYQVSRLEQHELAAECEPLKAAEFARSWQPDVIIATRVCLDNWQNLSDGLASVVGHAGTIVTADAADRDLPWVKWARAGLEVLLKPIVHPMAISAAIAAASATGGI